ncbi:MAG: metallophosphoesterase family protein [Opitutales bacterium]
MTTRIAHISDLHFGKVDDPELIEALLDTLNSGNWDLVVASGDFVQIGKREEFEAARSFLRRLEKPVLGTAGNHDIPWWPVWERFVSPYRKYHAYLRPEMNRFWENEQLVIAALNTARPFGWTWDWSRGRVSLGDLERIAEHFRRVGDGRRRAIVAHHPFWLPQGGDMRRLVKRHDPAIGFFRDNNVTLLMTGHEHTSVFKRLGEEGAPLIMSQAASTTSSRLRGEPNSFNALTLEDDGSVSVDRVAITGEVHRPEDAETEPLMAELG